MSLEDRAIEVVESLVDEMNLDARIQVVDEGLKLTDPHGRGASLELTFASDTRMSIKVGVWSLLEMDSNDTEGLLADIRDILVRVLEGGLEEHVWRRGDKIIAARLLGVGHVVSRSTLTPRHFGSKEITNYSGYRRNQIEE